MEDEDAEGGVDCVAETYCVSTTEMEIGGKQVRKKKDLQHNQHRRQINCRSRRGKSAVKSEEGVLAVLEDNGT